MIEHAAVSAVYREVAEWGWVFREQPAADLGIDAQVERVSNEFLTGQLIALVIKAGSAYFSEAGSGGWIYRGSNDQLLYWLRHSLPVVILLRDPQARVTYWAHVTSEAIQYTRTGWAMVVPSAQVLSPESAQAFAALAMPAEVPADYPHPPARWLQADRAVARAAAMTAEPLRQPSADEFYEWIGTLIDRFQHAVEHSDLWRALWDDKLTTPRNEKIAQSIAGTIWTLLCEAADVDIARETNIGRGPVDFKFSAGWQRRALIEVKLLASPKLRQGAELQLAQYMASERLSCAYYVCIGFTDADLHSERTKVVRDTCEAYGARSGHTVTPRFIDARPKESASRLRQAKGRRSD